MVDVTMQGGIDFLVSFFSVFAILILSQLRSSPIILKINKGIDRADLEAVIQGHIGSTVELWLRILGF